MKWNIFKRNQKEETLKDPTPEEALKRAELAVDELNAAIAAFPPELRHIRAYVRSGDARTRRRSKVMLGYWETVGGPRFVVTYGDDPVTYS